MSEADALAAVGDGPVMFYDGHCTLCHGAVRFLLPRDRAGVLRYAPLQAPESRAVLGRYGVDPDRTDSVVLVERGRAFVFSDAALRVAKYLTWPWRWGRVFLVVPRFLRDAVYKFIARNRARWFGRDEQCLLPRAGWRERFLFGS